jgi:hypothetical protein
MTREDEIRIMAYEMWEREGCPDGRDCEHWLKAETVWVEQQKKTPAPKAGKTKQGQPAFQSRRDRGPSRK